MYQIRCDGNLIFDSSDKDLTVLNPRCKLEVNCVGEASFRILPQHPFYEQLKKLKSIFQINQGNHILFRGRMTNDSKETYNQKDIDIEGVLAFANDSYIPPFKFPDDFTIQDGSNVVEVLLRWFLDRHNEQVQDWQKLYLGNVTVTDKNNVIVRSSEKYLKTWDCLKDKLFDSSLGGYICIRYEEDGNYVDYLKDFPLTNVQKISFGENLLELLNESSGEETYSAVLPFGAEFEYETGKARLNLDSIPDGDITQDIVKQGRFIYSKSAVAAYGWICAPVEDTTWEDVTVAGNLVTKSVDFLTSSIHFTDTLTVKAVDLHFSDEDIQSFRIYRNVLVDSPFHGMSNELFELTILDLDLMNPQNTYITIGKTTNNSIDDYTTTHNGGLIEKIESVGKLVDGVNSDVANIKQQVVTLQTSVTSTCESIILNAMQDYVKTGDYESFQQTVSSQLQVMASEITMNFTTTTNSVENINGDMQNRFEQLSKYIKFSGETALTLGTGEGAITLELDPETGISFKKNGVQFGWWDGTDFHTGNIVVNVNERAQFGDFAFIPRSDRSLMFLKVSG